MIRNYFKIAIRSLVKHKIYSLTNILGLTVGLAACISIFLWVMDELSFDRFHSKTDRIYKVMINDIYPDGRMETYEAPTVKIGEALRTNIPEIEKVTQTSWTEDMLLKSGDKNLMRQEFMPTRLCLQCFPFRFQLAIKRLLFPISIQ